MPTLAAPAGLASELTFNVPLLSTLQPDVKVPTLETRCVAVSELKLTAPAGAPQVFECQKTTQYLTDFEVTKVLGERATQIDRGAPYYVQENPLLNSAIKIAAAEMLAGVVPLEIIRLRPVSTEVIPFSKLKLTNDSYKKLLRYISSK